jgi:hypothetical protein
MRLDGERRKGYTFVDRPTERKTRRRRRGAIVLVAISLATVAGVVQLASAASDPRSTYAGTRLTARQAMEAAYRAGFHSERQLVIVTAIGIAESGLVTKTRNWHPEFGYRSAGAVIGVQGPASAWSGNRQMHSDRGAWQISSHAWPQYTDAQTDDPATAAKIMFSISRNGTDFTPWNTYTGGDYAAYANGSHDGWPALGPVARSVIATGGGSPPPKPAPKPAPKPVTSGSGVRMAGVYITAYDYYVSNPHQVPATSRPVLHRRAGGTGTFANPITVAVADGSNGGLQFRAGTKFYVPNLRAYFVAEDSMGQSSGGRVHLNVWADGRTSSASSSYNCASHVTGNYLVIRNPSRKYAVVPGPLAAHNRCRRLFGNALVTREAAARAHAAAPRTVPKADSGTAASDSRPPVVERPDPPAPLPTDPPDTSAPSDTSVPSDAAAYVRWSSATYCRR